MRMFALLTAGWVLSVGTTTLAQVPVQTAPVYQAAPAPCAKCGAIHASSTVASSPVQVASPTSYSVTDSSRVVPSSARVVVARPAMVASNLASRVGSGVRNVLSALNAQRARQGIGSLRYDPVLQEVAQRRAQQMAASGQKGHPPGSFAPGRYEGVGWSSSYSPSGVSACYTSDSRMQYAGAAMATGQDGVYFAVVYR